LTASSLLPDPFTRLNGTRISSLSDWTCRREEILQLAEKYVYGAKPPKPASVTGTVSSTNITVNVSNNGKSASWSAGVQLPSTGSGPFPAVIVYGGAGVDTATILASGAAVINYNPYNVGAEGLARDSDTGAFYTLYGPSNSTGLLMAWAWGVSRIIDVIEQSGGNILKADDTGVTGCSRFGKGALVAGAFDQRIPLTMPVESGTDGVPIFRGVPGESGAQPLGEAYGEQPWVGDAFNQFTSNPGMLPVDTHEIVGMVAPRGLFIMENPHVDWLAATSGSVAALGAAEVYKALGAGNNISYWSNVADGTHCAVRPEWQAPLAASIKFFLENQGAPPAVFQISSLKQGNLAQWRNWTTPTLTNGNTVTVQNPGPIMGKVGVPLSVQLLATDSDPTQTLTWSATGLPSWATINGATGVLSGTPTAPGAFTLTVTATDATGARGSASFTISISPASTVTVTNPGAQSGTVGTAVTLQLSATDSAPGQTLTWSATGLPPGLSISGTSTSGSTGAGLISGTPTTSGNFTVTVTATDGTGASGSATFGWTIAVTPIFTLTNPGPQTGTVGTPVSLQIHATDPGNTVTYTAAGLPAGLAINGTTGLISGTPTTAGSNNVTLTVTDNVGASGSATFPWTITGSGSCHVTYTKNSEWPGGFTAQVVIGNTGTTAITSWSLTFTFPGDQKVTSNFNGGFSQTGENVTLTNASYNGSIAAGSSITDGFQGSWTSNDTNPTSFSVNGTACK
jgi:hypothetical protein